MSSIQKEDDLQIQVMKNIDLGKGFFFPKIRRIAGNRISPEIDLLRISDLVGEKTLIGYEFKLLKSETNDENRRHIYKGIGQALMYFQYGIDFSYLLLGISKNAFNSEISDPFINILYHVTQMGSNPSFGIMVWRERNPKDIETYLKPEASFQYGSSKEYTLCRMNLLNGNFVYDKSFLTKISKNL